MAHAARFTPSVQTRPIENPFAFRPNHEFGGLGVRLQGQIPEPIYIVANGDHFRVPVSFTRISEATYFNSSGALTTAAIGEPRFDFNPLTLAPRGFLVEGSRTNLLLNSATLSTQSITVTAAAHSLSFYGTGSIALSGAFVGSLNGAGAFPNRATLIFTPSAGSLTLTVTGSVTFAQCELGAFTSSYIPTTGATATRAADVALITNLASIGFNPLAGTILSEIETPNGNNSFNRILEIGDGGSSNYIAMQRNNQEIRGTVVVSAVIQANTLSSGATSGTIRRAAMAYATDDVATCVAGINLNTDGSATLPTGLIQAGIGGNSLGGFQFGGWIRSLTYFPTRLPNATILSLTA